MGNIQKELQKEKKKKKKEETSLPRKAKGPEQQQTTHRGLQHHTEGTFLPFVIEKNV
jgi:hypothetical protein